MTINEFITKIVKGGYRYHGDKLRYDEKIDKWYVNHENGGYFLPSVYEIFLDPEAWRAFSLATYSWRDIRGFDEDSDKAEIVHFDVTLYMYKMIDHLIDGGTVTDYIETL